ncbi:hypothetical protein Tco_0618459 [Tanacetum coccineum]
MSPQNGSISTHSSNYQMKLEKALDDFNSQQEKRLKLHGFRKYCFNQPYQEGGAQKKGNQKPIKAFSLKYLSIAYIIELSKNPSALKCVHFVNSIVILSEENKAEEGETTTDITPKNGHNIAKEAKDEVKEVMEEDESEVETDWEVEEILEDEEEDGDASIPYPRPPMKKTLAMEGSTTIKAYSLEMSTCKTEVIFDEKKLGSS